MSLLINGLAVWVAAQVVPGVRLDGYVTALLVAVLLAVMNWTVKPVLFILTLPATILTLGLFYLILNVIVVLIVDWLVPGLAIDGWGAAVMFGVVMWLVNMVLGALTKED